VHLLAFLHADELNTKDLVSESRKELAKFCKTVKYLPLTVKSSNFRRYHALLVSLFSKPPFSVYAHRSLDFKRAMSKLLAETRIDVVHYDTLALAQFDDVDFNFPKVLTHHNIESLLMARRAKRESNPFVRLYLSLQARKIARYELIQAPRFDANIMMSSVDAERLQKDVPGVRTAVVPNGVDLDYFRPEVVDESPTLIYTGGMNMFANKDAVLHFLQNIWPWIKMKVPDVKFFAVGQDPPRELLSLSRADPQIEVTGYVDDVRPLIAQASVYVVPLRVGGGTRLKILDAMAMGKPIVSTSIGCEGIDVSPGGNIVIADEPEVFADRTVRLLQNKTMRTAFGQAARQLVESKYSWKTVGQSLQNTYENVLRQRRSKFLDLS
jgi:glycosyltransferase involved in cell wall biosynthesis